MKIVLAPDSYKGSLTAGEACDAMERGIRRAVPEAHIVKVPMADGGEGTVRSLVDATGGTTHKVSVRGPLGAQVEAMYGVLGDGATAVIEVAEASGLYLIRPEERNPLAATTYGMGELIKDALDRGCRSFIIGLGGSATNDGGAGMAQALGARFLDESGRPVGQGGEALGRLASIDGSGMDPRLRESRFIVACDVDNPLCGPQGASAVFGPQKGATPEMADRLDEALRTYAAVVQRDIGADILELPGAGAAGGLGGGAVAFLNAELKPGVEIVIEAAQLAKHLEGADLVLSGEGQCDFQTERGKTPYGVAKQAKRLGVPCVLIAGSIGQGIECLYDSGVVSVFPLTDKPMPLEQAMREAHRLAEDAAERVVRLFALLKKRS
ncbi:glycerate kinase [Paenibacillus doosanensis]|uniref:glycerate kinase n=1 Tax=Paenibacillus doosanensis TaxID=1229154 RepID=UPI0021802D1C|nr:glycerate kinase [Paenibacillus doosanensis]MCS7462009.1 glycerate kinase [Paenibacillus doosanensis]